MAICQEVINNFPKKDLRLKRRRFACVFQVVESRSIRNILILLPKLAQAVSTI
jgi:hypothetical protein